ncbi:hypothetical protein L2D14_08030 [Thalassospiraceae bacterium LMO-JJ14]|nr:hypothetical protein L2D14_08030 [Thalassospiraceae bacterium LMO-JJ14]
MKTDEPKSLAARLLGIVRSVRVFLKPRTRVRDAFKFIRRWIIRYGDPLFVLVYDKKARRFEPYPLLCAINRTVLMAKARVLLRLFPQPRQPKGLAVFSFWASPFAFAQILPTLLILRRNGWATVLLDEMGLPLEPSGIAEFDSLHGCFVHGRTPATERLEHEWIVDWDARSIRVDGLEVYTQIWERLSKQFMRHTFPENIRETGEFRNSLQGNIAEADAALTVAEKLLDIKHRTGLPVRILGIGFNFNTTGIIFQFVLQKCAGEDLHFAGFSDAQQNYFDRGRAREVTAFALENMSLHRNLRMPFLPVPEKFEAWLGRQADGAGIPEKVRRWVEADRTSIVGPSKSEIDTRPAGAREAIERIKAHRAGGGRVYCLIGKIVYDIAMPRDTGPAHADMVDWLNHTIETVAGTDILLLIKPHPSEARVDFAGVPNEFFLDLVRSPLPPNVQTLGHHWLNNFELAGLIDLGLVWAGTSILEFGVLGVPVIAGSDWARRDFPVDTEIPSDRADYETRLLDVGPRTVSPGHRLRCARVLEYNASPEISLPMKHAWYLFSNARSTGPRLRLLRSLLAVLRRDSGPWQGARKAVAPHRLG